MLWEKELPYLRVRKEVVERGYHSVMRELQNDARDPSMALFNMDEAMTFSVTDEGFRRGDGRVVPWHDIGDSRHISTPWAAAMRLRTATPAPWLSCGNRCSAGVA